MTWTFTILGCTGRVGHESRASWSIAGTAHNYATEHGKSIVMAETGAQEFEEPAVDQDADGARPRSAHRGFRNGRSSHRVVNDDRSNGRSVKIQTAWRQAQTPHGLLYGGAGTSHWVTLCVRHIVNRQRRAFQEEVWVRSVKLSCVTIFSPSYIM